MMEQWYGKVALVVGGGAGIGRATALAFASRGVRVVVADIQVSGGEATAQQIRREGGQALFVPTDVCQANQVRSLVETVVGTYGRLDCACNTAGIDGQGAPTAECSEENWDRVLLTNLKGVWLCMKHELGQMLAQGGGAIVNMSCVAGLFGSANHPAYSASKHGVLGLTRTAAREYATQGIRVNAICPGISHTAMVHRLNGGGPKIPGSWVAKELGDAKGRPEEVAELVLWLCSEAAFFVTGYAIAVDAGFAAPFGRGQGP